MNTKESFWTIPNMLSLYRILVFPFVVYLIFSGQEKMYAIFIALNLISDWLDGQIARRFNMRTQIGAKLDSYADVGTYILVFLGIFVFKWAELQAEYLHYILAVFLGLYIIDKLFAIVKYGRFPSYHNYIFKTTGYIQGIFFMVWFLIGFYDWFYFIALGVGMIACIEEIILTALLPEPMSDVKGLFWILKQEPEV